MSSQSATNPWDFTEALDLLHALARPLLPESADYVPVSPSSSTSSSPSESPRRRPTLGNFDRIFRKLNRPITIEALDTHGTSLDDRSSVSETGTTPPTTPPHSDSQHFNNLPDVKEVRWTDQVDEADGNSSRKRKRSLQNSPNWQKSSSNSVTHLTAPVVSKGTQSRPAAFDTHLNHRRSTSHKSNAEAVGGESAFESEADSKSGDWWLKKSHYEISRGDAKAVPYVGPASIVSFVNCFVPALMTPQQTPLQTPPKLLQLPVCIDSGTITPMLCLTKQEKQARLIRRLGEKFGVSLPEYFDLPRPLSQYGGNVASNGVHVFVDSSNIVIGFNDALKLARGVHLRAYTKRAPLSFQSLAMIMERGRGVAKRVLVGSSDRGGELPDYMQEAASCGYEINSLDRVEKFKETRLSIRKSRGGNGYVTSGQSSGSETPMTGSKKVTEQGVDEILHMKMLESIVDSKEPSTIVLATGDAAEAEYSGGFLKNVERALNKGWKVELVAWGHSMSYAYRSRDFLDKWKNQFMIVNLDDFSEELLGVYIESGHV